MPVNFPFAAIVGQAELKAALLRVAVDPAIGGVLVTGTRGTAKSTAVRALADLLPPIDVIAGDAFNRAPGAGANGSASIPTPFVEFPIGATEDRVIGTLDVRALLAGERRFEPGLLARANRGILYVDEVNLLPDHLVDVVLDAAATGTNVVERDGASYAHDARIVLVGTMNPEEGELRPQLLDRFGLCVAIENDGDLERRVEIVERRIAFERDPEAFVVAYAAQTAALGARVVRARELLPTVVVDRAALRRAAEHALAASVEGMRADLTIVRAARAIAALDGRDRVGEADIDAAAPAALAHRRREPAPGTSPPSAPSPPPSTTNTQHAPAQSSTADSTSEPAMSNASLQASPSSAQPSSDASPVGDGPEPRDGSARENGAPTAGAAGADRAEQTFTIGDGVEPPLDRVRAAARSPQVARVAAARGRGGEQIGTGRTRAILATTSRIAALATIRAAAEAGFGAATRLAVAADGDEQLTSLVVRPQDIRFVQRRGRARALVVFLIDASGSMAAAARMRAAKGVVCSLLVGAYRRRDAVALVAFRGEDAATLVPPTRSAVLAYRRLRSLATGGRTPLGRGLAHAGDLIAAYARREPAIESHLVIVSDARANAPASGALDLARREALRLRARGIRALWVDTEAGRIRFGFAAHLASALDASYRHLDDCTERALGATVREWMATA